MVRSLSFFALAWLLAVPAAAQQVELFAFSLPTCGPCHAMAPTVSRLAAEGVSVRRVDGSREPGVAQRFGVSSYPTFVAVAGGQEVGRIVGATSYKELRKLSAGLQNVAGAAPNFGPSAVGGGGTFAVGGDFGPGTPAKPRPSTPVAAAAPVAAPSPAGGTLIDASVRLTMVDQNTRAYGTGTIVDARQGEALVVTCAHLFRGEGDQVVDTTGKLTVEIYRSGPAGPTVVESVSGQLVSHDFEADVALVAIRAGQATATAPVASSPGDLRVGDAVQSVGCDNGADPTVRQSQVVALNRYNGPPNIEASGAPVQGRSGGGLFDANGRLVGVCNFADKAADEGIYAGLQSIHDQLDRIGLSQVYRGGVAAPAAIAASAPPAAAPSAGALASSSAPPLDPVRRSPAAEAVVRGQNAIEPPPLDDAFASTPAPLSAAEEATIGEIVSRGARSEVVVLIRPEGGGGATEVLTLDATSPEFVAALRRMGESPTTIR